MKYIFTIILAAVLAPCYAQDAPLDPNAQHKGLIDGKTQLLIMPGKAASFFDPVSGTYKQTGKDSAPVAGVAVSKPPAEKKLLGN